MAQNSRQRKARRLETGEPRPLLAGHIESRIVQVRGKHNELPGPRPLGVVRRWADEQGLTVR